ncbi:EF-hand domain-containing member C2 [Globomyces sp. JEL0801]|nr:EF-hand domain-containing member C2 [Globomyces sp. JEL0801]
MLEKDALHQLQKQLPFLPGHQFDIGKSRANERKSHAFDYCNQVPIFKGEAKGIGGKPLTGQLEQRVHTSLDSYPHTNASGEAVPAWVAFDRKVLRFYGYFQECVHERREEKYRVRRRHRIPKAGALNGQHFVVSDFNVGKEITLYSRTIKLVGCDQFTRDFLTKLHTEVPSNEAFPPDPYETHRNEMLSRMKATRPSVPNLSLKQFLENDRHVLRFYCVWDDSTSVFGDLRHMVVHYYLSDDTMEIKESIPANSGRESNTLFLRRCRLPKRPHVNSYSSTTENQSNDYFTDADLMLGSVIHLYGRPFVICDCDEFTKNYYREHYDVYDFDPVRIQEFQDDTSNVPFFDAAAHQQVAQASEPSALLIGADSQKKDFKKLMSYDGITLRFLGQLVSAKQVDRDRKFVISLHLADDTISIFEPRARNSGIIGGKFLENRRIKKGKTNQYFGPEDFYIGAELVFFQHHFLITGADEYAVKFMDLNANLFPSHQKK